MQHPDSNRFDIIRLHKIPPLEVGMSLGCPDKRKHSPGTGTEYKLFLFSCDIRDLLKATISLRDGKPLTEMKLGFKEKIAVSKALDFIKGTDVEKLLREYQVI